MSNSATFSLPEIQGYFQSQRASVNGNLETNLIQFIEKTQHSLDVAIFDMHEQPIVDSLKQLASKHGIKVRIAYDNSKPDKPGKADPKSGDVEDVLQKSGLIKYSTQVHASGSHLMHNKFIVRDGQTLWTGSANFTPGGMLYQDNNCLVVESADLCKAYETYFESLLSDHKHSTRRKSAAASAGTGNSKRAVQVGSVKITPYFSPDPLEDVERGVTVALKNAKEVRIASMVLTDPETLQELQRFKPSGANIKGLYDAPEQKFATSKTKLDQSLFWFSQPSEKRFIGVHTTPYPKNPDASYKPNFMHNKFMILDNHTVITGSYNFSENAEKNDENLLVIESAEVAKAYCGYFDAMFNFYEHNNPPHGIPAHN